MMDLLFNGIKFLIEIFYQISGDYGIAIIILTLLIRLCMLPINRKQKESIRRQQDLSIQIATIKEKYKKNPSKANKEIEALYQQEKSIRSGCLLSIIQLPVMLALYNGIRLAIDTETTTVLFPWISSLMFRDTSYILPVIATLIQILPQLFPYMRFFSKLNLNKMSIPMLLLLLFSNGCFSFMMPAGITLYYIVSGMFTFTEQLIDHIWEIKRIANA